MMCEDKNATNLAVARHVPSLVKSMTDAPSHDAIAWLSRGQVMCGSTRAEAEGTDELSEEDDRSDSEDEGEGDDLENDLEDDEEDDLEVDEDANDGLDDGLVDELAS
jgi:hypothetical protein